MSKIGINTTTQDDVLRTNAGGLAADEAQPTGAGYEPIATPEETAVSKAHSTKEPVEEAKRGISSRKLTANRANAQRSTGPRTPEGKANSKLNATKHGFTSRYFPALIQAGTAEWQEFDAVRTDLIDHCQPIGAIEELLVEKITIEYMRYRRLVEREQLLCDHNRGYYLEIVDKLTRYQTAINRQLFEAMRALERLQASRKEREAKDEEPKGSSE